MAGGVRLGSAYFELDASSAPLIQALSDAQQASAKSVQAIAQQLGKSEKDVQRLAQTWLSAEKQRADASAAATLKIIKAHNDAAAAAAKNSAGLLDIAKSGVALGAGLAGVQLGLEGVRKGLEFVTEETGKAAQAQFALNALYGDASPIITKFAEAQALAFGKSKSDAKEAAANVATLTRNYALSGEQVQKVLTISANLAAVRGIGLEAAAERTQSALRGEAEAIEYLGVAVQSNALKALANMTAEQRKNFETLSDVTKAQIILNAITDQTADLQGKAADRLNTASGATDNLKGRSADLAATLGTGLSPSIAAVENGLAGWIKRMDEAIQKSREVAANQRVINAGLTHGIVDIPAGEIQIGPDPGLPGAGPGPTPAQAQAAQDAINAAKREAARRADQRKADKAAREQEAKDGAEVAEAIHRREVKDLDDRRTILEAEREAKRRAVEDERDSALKGIEAEARAAKDASDAKIARLRVEEEAAKRSAQATHERAIKELEIERQGVEDATAENIRSLEIVRDKRKQAAEDQRDLAIRELEDAQRLRDNARVKEDRDLDDQTTKIQRALDVQAKAAERRFDREAAAAEKAHDRAIRKLEGQGKKEDDRHRRALANIDAEAQRQTDAIDAQIAAIDAVRKARENANRTSDLQGKVSEARAALGRAQGTGTAAEIAAARGDLTSALRGGDPTSIANARERLNQLAGQGADAVKKAQTDLTKALADLQDEQTSEVEDAQKEQLQAEKDRIKSTADAEKDAENEKDRRRKDSLAKDKQAADDTYKSAKASIDKRKADEKDAHDLAVQQSRDVAEKAKRDVQDRRRVEDQADQDKRREITDTYDLEQRQIKATYDDEETGAIPALRRALAAYQRHYQERKDAADAAYQDEQQQIQDTYTDPEKGLIPLAEKAAQKVAQGFQIQADAVRDRAKDQTQYINDVYSSTLPTGLLYLIEQARKDSEDKLQNQRDYWKDWAEDLGGENGQIAKVIGKTKELISQIEKLGTTPGVTVNGGITTSPGPGEGDQPGGGPGPNVGSDGAPEPYAVSFPFGARYSNPFNEGIPIHRGVDLVVRGAPNGGEGRPVEAFEDGTVVYNAFDRNGGNGIIIRGKDGLYHRYFHFDDTSVSVGDEVHRGDRIGTLGQTGTEGSPHLHYEVSKNVGGDPIGDLIDPMPYLRGGDGSRSRTARTFTFDLFGRRFTVTLPAGTSNALIRQIEKLGTDIGGRDFGRAAAAIALSEGAAGDLGIPGSGGARGPFQFDPSGELPNYARYLGVDLGAAGDYAAAHPLDAASWALRGYLGEALREGIDEGLRGADLAEYGSRVGQRPYGDLWKLAGDASRQLYGYRNGGWIPTPSYIVDAATNRPYAFAGEAGPERVLSPEASSSWGSDGGSYHEGDVNVYGVGLQEVAYEVQRKQQTQRLLRGGQRWR